MSEQEPIQPSELEISKDNSALMTKDTGDESIDENKPIGQAEESRNNGTTQADHKEGIRSFIPGVVRVNNRTRWNISNVPDEEVQSFAGQNLRALFIEHFPQFADFLVVNEDGKITVDPSKKELAAEFIKVHVGTAAKFIDVLGGTSIYHFRRSFQNALHESFGEWDIDIDFDNKPKKFWKDLDHIRDRANQLLHEHGHLYLEDIKIKDPSFYAAVTKYYPGRWPQLKAELGLDRNGKRIENLTPEMLRERALISVANNDGVFSVSILDDSVKDAVRKNIYPGGMLQLKRDIGARGPTGRVPHGYWKIETIEEEANKLVVKGHSLKAADLARDFSGLLTAIHTIYPGKLVGLKKKLGIEEHVQKTAPIVTKSKRPNGFWQNESNIETELRKIIDQIGDFPEYNIINKTDSSLALMVTRNKGINYWRQRMGFSVKSTLKNGENKQISPDEADEMMRSFEIEQ